MVAFLLAADLYNGVETDHWVQMAELSASHEPRVSPKGISSFDIETTDLKGKTISQLEKFMKIKGYMLVSVGYDKIYFQAI
jgi:hypothetical protein